MPTAAELYQQFQTKTEPKARAHSVPSLNCWVCRDLGVVRRLEKFIQDPEMLSFYSNFAIACGCKEGQYKDHQTHVVLDEISPSTCQLISDDMRQQEMEFAKAQAQGIQPPEVEMAKNKVVELAKAMTLMRSMSPSLNHEELMALDAGVMPQQEMPSPTEFNNLMTIEDLPF